MCLLAGVSLESVDFTHVVLRLGGWSLCLAGPFSLALDVASISGNGQLPRSGLEVDDDLLLVILYPNVF
jgi:hypothetical protein